MLCRLGHRRAAVLALALFTASSTAFADDLVVEMSNLLEIQSGRDFNNEEEDRNRFFDQFVLDAYPSANVRLGLRVERFQDSPPPSIAGFPIDEYEYDRLAQRFVEWSGGGSSLRLGNGYAILGHGLLFRAFELPGVVRQSLFPIVSYAESRDLDGAIFETWRGPFEVTLLHGTPVVSPDTPPEQMRVARSGGSVTGGRAMVTALDGLRIGGSVLHTDGLESGAAASTAEELGAIELHVEPLRLIPGAETLPLYLSTAVEYASRTWRPFVDGLATATGKPHALYTNTQVGWSGGALGIETKDYHQFRLAVNDAPTLVPEFTHRLLNRTTHVLDPLDEKGLQLTLGQALPSWLGAGSVEAVHARSRGRLEILGEFIDHRRYEQSFVAVESDPRRRARLRVYFSDGRDEFESFEEIRTVGFFVSSALPRELAVELDVGHQVRKRTLFGQIDRADDLAVVASISRAGFGSVGLLYERSNDSLFLDDPFTDEIESDPRGYLGGTVSWRVNGEHDAVLFAGKRRGGTSCTSGTCYFVPDFEGVEMRVLSRF